MNYLYSIGQSMIPDVLTLYKFLDERLESKSIFSALFSWDGTKKQGDDVIKVLLHKVNENQWFYEIGTYNDYIFIPFPVNPVVNMDYGISNGEKNPNVKLFRFVASPLAIFNGYGEKNLKVDFFVFGYKPSDLLNRRKKQS